MLRQWLSYELADCESSIFLAAVPFLVNIIVPIPPSYPGGHVEAECSACAVPPVDKVLYVTVLRSYHNQHSLDNTRKGFSYLA